MKEIAWSDAIKRKYPKPVILVVSCDRNGNPNIQPAGWGMPTSGTSPMLAVSINHENYTHDRSILEETRTSLLNIA